jgi:L-threonylcarbamoyladenylate synthase
VVVKFDCSNPDDIIGCANLIDKGGVVIFPTDTVYGIGCDPTNEQAVLKLYNLKNRSINKTLPLLTFSQTMVSEIAQISTSSKILMDMFWPGQLTLVLNSKKNKNIRLCKYVYDDANQSIALRVPGNQCIRDIIRITKSKLLVGTSANISQHPSSKSFGELDMGLVSKCDGLVYNNTRLAGIENTATPKEGKTKEMFATASKVTTTSVTEIKDIILPTSSPASLQTPTQLYLNTRGSRMLKVTTSESTIIDLTNEHAPRVVREGAVPKDKIIEVLKNTS